MMKRKSFGKLAIVTVLATLMLFGLCVCSKKADTSTATTTTTTATTTTTPAATTTTTAETTATTTTAKVEEPVAETKVEEPVVETKVEEPVAETKVEEVVAQVVETAQEVVEAAKEVVETVAQAVAEEEVVAVEETAVAAETEEEELPEFSAIFSYKGVTSNIVAYSDHASVTIPEGVTEDDISSIAYLLLALYPEASEVTYYVQDGTLYLTYPEQGAEFIQTAVATLDSEAKWYIDEVAKAGEVVETAETIAEAVVDVIDNTELTIADDGTITCTYNYHDLATAKVVMGNEKTTITYPAEFIYKSDIEAFIAQVVEAYPILADYVTYAIPEDGTLEIYYPSDFVGGTEYKLETLAYADEAVTEYADAMLSDLLAQLGTSIDELNTALETVIAEEAAEEVPVFSTIFTYKGITSDIYAYSDYAIITIPEGVTEDDIAYLASMLVAAYPEAEAVQYLVADGSLILFYPEQSDEFIQLAVAQLESDAEYVIDLLSSEEVEEVEVAKVDEGVETAEAVAEAVVDVIDNTELTIADDGTITCTYNYHDLATAKVVMGNEKTTITYPAEFIYKSDIEAFIAQVVEAYPVLADYLTYAIPEDGTLEIYYPSDFVGGTYYKLETLAKADEAVTEYADAMLSDLLAQLETSLDELNTALETVVAEEAAEEVAVEEAPVFSTIFTYKGITSNIVAYSDHATISIPEGTTEADIMSCALMLVEAYPEATAVQYSVDGDVLTLYYPAQSDDFIQLACVTLESEAEYLIDAIYASMTEETAVAEAVVETAPVAEVVVETAPVAEAAPAVVEEKKEEPVTVAAPAPVAEPVAAKEEFISSFSVAGAFEGGYNITAKSINYAGGLRAEYSFTNLISAGVKLGYNFKYNYFFADAYGKFTFAQFGKASLYAAASVGVDYSFTAKKAGLELGGVAGFEYEIIDNVSIFAEVGYKYSFLTKSHDVAASLGAKYSF